MIVLLALPLKSRFVEFPLAYLLAVLDRSRCCDDDHRGDGRHEEGELGHVAAETVLVEVPQGRSIGRGLSSGMLLRSFYGSSRLGPSQVVQAEGSGP